MENLHMKQLYLALITGLFAFSGVAQNSFVKGYLINDKGDTLRGEVKYNPKKEQDCYNKVYFKDANGVVKNYKPKKAKGYGFNDQNFVAMDFESELKFYRVLVYGEINLYRMAYEEIRMNQEVLGGEYFIAHKDAATKLTSVKEGKFKKQMLEWMKDNPEFINEYNDKDFNAENAAEVIRKYNTWKAAN
jgi:hypothetical protein